ncbi:family 1 glycosylhydrolase [Anoxybacterium hadale]|uniref:Family 1 glycosylhydrolase n=1 Tax=Anoxybacterium hadale TaxID=3408580 RepID=A0ACD1AD84_9FIRM|nr:family 1 glycosylhydrolase [Clostridiales bacterium]
MTFPTDFLWGAGSAAYQIEGAWNKDKKGPSIWDDFCHTPGHIRGDETGDIAADAYHRFETDLAVMKEIGLKSYRFSISWPRIFPDGKGRLNKKGFVYYDRIVDDLLNAEITPFITLYHWDLPLALERSGGWRCRDTADAFIRYAEEIARHFDGRVKHYITLNEPQCFIGLGYVSALHAPGRMLSQQAAVQCIHHALLAHGGAISAMRSASSSSLQIGLASTGKICFPEAQNAKALSPQCHNAAANELLNTAEKAAYDATFRLDKDWTFSHTWLLDAAVTGIYPEEMAAFRILNETISDADRRAISEPMDLIGLNIYNGVPVDKKGNRIKKAPGFPRTALKWPITPACMYYGPKFLYKRYGLPIIITENGQSCNDRIFLDGSVHDVDRIDFLTQYLLKLKEAVAEGIPLRGYFHWSLTDNFEWHSGYDERFGLTYIDYETQRRIIKDSGYWYRELIRINGDLE